ncbi:MAG: 3-coathanger stack domain-containing protein, partial [Bacteroidota bacterium]
MKSTFTFLFLFCTFLWSQAQFYGVSFDNSLANSGGGWSSSSTNNVFWTTTSVKAPSITGINTMPQNGSGFAYSETDGTFSGSQATSFLESPCFDLSGTITRVQFAYQMLGDVDSFYLEVSFDDGMTYNQQVLSVPTGTVSDWVVDNTTGLNINGSVRFRFAAIFNSVSSSILAIDQLQFFGAQQNEAMDCPMLPTLPDCVENLSLNNTTLNEDFYRAKNQLTSNASIANNNNVTFTAGNQIVLTEGFVASNTTFTARIEDCNSVGFLLEEDYERSLPIDSIQVEYIDRFGNGYRKDELAITKSSHNCNSGFFNLVFLSSFTPSQEAVICSVFEDLSDIIIPRSPSPIVNITIEKEALSAINPNIIAVGSPYWQPDDCGIIYSRVEKAIMAADSTDDEFYHGVVKFNPDFLDLLYDGSQSSRDTLLDMYSITLHEAMHVLGFSSFINDTLGNSVLENAYSRYDQLLYSIEDDVALIELDTNGECCDQHIFNNLTSNNIRVGCSNMLYLRDDNLIAPVNGENIDVKNLLSHVNDECGGQNYVMNPSIGRGEVKDMLTLAEKEVLKNIGYDIVGLSSSCGLIATNDIINDVMVVVDDTLREFNLVFPYDSIVANDVVGIDYDLVYDSLCSDIRNATVSSDGTNINFFTQEAGTYTLCYEIFGCDGACDQGEIIINLNDTTQAVCTGCNITCVSDFETIDTQLELDTLLVGGTSPRNEIYFIAAQNSPQLVDRPNAIIGVEGGINNSKSIYVGYSTSLFQDTIFANIEGIFIKLDESVKTGDTLDFSINAEFINIEDTIYNPRVRVDFLSSDPVGGFANSRSVYINPGVVDSYEYLASDAFYIQETDPVATGGQIINNTDSMWTWVVLSPNADTISSNVPYIVGIVLDNIQMNKRRQVSLSSSASPSLSCNEGLYQLQYELCNLTDFGSAEMTLDLSIPDGFTVVDGDIFGSDTTIVLADDYIEADTCTIITLLLEQAPNVNIDDVFTFELTQSGSCYNTLVNEKSVRIINNPLSITKSFTENQGTYDILIEVCNSLDMGIDSVRIEDAVPNNIALLSTGGFQQMENLLLQYDSIPANTCVQYAYSMNLPDNFCRGLYFASAEIEGSGCDQALDDINLNTPLVKPTIVSAPSSNIFCSAEDFFIDYELFNDHCTSTDSISLELILPTGINLENAGL